MVKTTLHGELLRHSPYRIKPIPKRSNLRIELCLWIYIYIPTILCSNARAPVAQLVRASDRHSEDPGSNPGWISMPFFIVYIVTVLTSLILSIYTAWQVTYTVQFHGTPFLSLPHTCSTLMLYVTCTFNVNLAIW